MVVVCLLGRILVEVNPVCNHEGFVVSMKVVLMVVSRRMLVVIVSLAILRGIWLWWNPFYRSLEAGV